MTLLSRWLVACGFLAMAGCSAETQGGAITSLTRAPTGGSAGAAGAPSEIYEAGSPRRSTDGLVYGVDGDLMTGNVRFAAGTMESGSVDLACCRAGIYDVYTYEDASCDDPETWEIERSARIAHVTCSNDLGTAPYVRDPADAATLAFVIYDAAGTALGCADVALD